MISFLESFLQRWGQHPGALKLGAVLLHFLWQGALLAGMALVMLIVCRRSRPQVRYAASLTIYSLMALAPIATFSLLQPPAAPIAEPMREPGVSPATARPAEPDSKLAEPQWIDVQSPAGSPVIELPREPQAATAAIAAAAPVTLPETAWRDRWIEISARLQSHLHWIVAGWLAGVSLLSLRLLIGLIGAEWARRMGVIAIADQIQRAVDRLAARIGIRHRVVAVESSAVEVPTLTGWFRPVILLPASALCGLYPEQLEAIMAHELAHVRRHDYLVNLIQTVIETVLFYHPAVWWLSRRIRQEREHCCDDMAIALCTDRVTYAHALASMEELRSASRWVVAARGGSLVERISRMLGRQEPVPPGRSAVLFVAVVVSIVLVATWQWRTTLQADESPQMVQPLETVDEDRNERPGTKTAATDSAEIVRQLSERIAPCVQPDRAVKTLSYDIQLGGRSMPIRVQRGQRRRMGVWQGTTLQGALQQLLQSPDRFLVAIVNPEGDSREMITLRITPKAPQNSFTIEAGNGVENSWRGYFSQGAEESSITIDARRMLPVEEQTGRTAIRYGDWDEVRPGKWAPKQVDVVREGSHYRMHFAWLADALWFLRKSESIEGEAASTLSRTLNVRINEQPIDLPIDAEERRLREAAREIVTLLDHNRPWLDRGTTGSGWQPPFETLEYSFRTEREDVRETCALDQNGEAAFELVHDGQGKLKERLGARLISLNGGEYASSRKKGQFAALHPRSERSKGPPFDLSLKQYARIGCQLDLPLFEYRQNIDNARVEVVDGQWKGKACRVATITDLPGTYLGCGTMLAFTSWSYLHHITPDKEVLYFDPERNVLLHETLIGSKKTFEIDFDDLTEVAPGQWAPLSMRIESPGYFTCEYRFQLVQERHWMLRDVVSWFDPENKSRGVIEDVSAAGPQSSLLSQTRLQVDRSRKLFSGEGESRERAKVAVIPLVFGEVMRHGPVEMKLTMPDRFHLELHVSTTDTSASRIPIAVFDDQHRPIVAATVEFTKSEAGRKRGSAMLRTSSLWNEARFVSLSGMEKTADAVDIAYVVPFRWDEPISVNVPEIQRTHDKRPAPLKTRAWKVRVARGVDGSAKGTVEIVSVDGPHQRNFDVSLALLDPNGRLIAAGTNATSLMIKSPPVEESFEIDLGVIPDGTEAATVLLAIVPGSITAAPIGSLWGTLMDFSPQLEISRLLNAGDLSFWRIGLDALNDGGLRESVLKEFEGTPSDRRQMREGRSSRKTLLAPHVVALTRLTRQAGSPDVVASAARWMAYSEVAEARTSVEGLLASNDDTIRDAAAVAMLFLGESQHLDSIRRILDRERPAGDDAAQKAARQAYDELEFHALVALAHQGADAAIDLLGTTLQSDLERLKPATDTKGRPILKGRPDRAGRICRLLAGTDGERTRHWLMVTVRFLKEHSEVSALFDRRPIETSLQRFGGEQAPPP